VRQWVKKELLEIEYIPTEDNISDIFTKPLARPRFEEIRETEGFAKRDEEEYQVGLHATRYWRSGHSGVPRSLRIAETG
jgi:hypothetical protein